MKRKHTSGKGARSSPEYRALYRRIRSLWLDGRKYPSDPAHLENRGKIAHVTHLMNQPAIQRVQDNGWHLYAVKKVSDPGLILPMLQAANLDIWYAKPYLFVGAKVSSVVVFNQARAEIVISDAGQATRWRIALDIDSMNKTVGFKHRLKTYPRELPDGTFEEMEEDIAWCLPLKWTPTGQMGYSAFRRESAEYIKNGVFGGGITNMAVMFISEFSAVATANKYANMYAQRQAKAARKAEYAAFNLSGEIRTS